MKKRMRKHSTVAGKNKDTFEVLHPNAAGIDVGSEEHWVCVPESRDENHIRRFGALTCDLYGIAKWLRECGVTTVAMESTGVYWIALFQVLEAEGFEVYLINARVLKRVPGRKKTDRLDCQWIQKLHSFGLLSASFRPADEICKIRSVLRHRDTLIRMSTQHIQHMQKSLHQMNILLDKVISDISGLTGLKIIEAIIGGERDPERLATLKHSLIKAPTERIKKSLEGDWREEHIFTLAQSYRAYKFIQQQIIECDREVEGYLRGMDKKVDARRSPLPRSLHKRMSQKNNPTYDARTYFYEITGVDLFLVPGVQAATIQTFISEVGVNMHKWETEKQFTSWLGLSPNHEITGGAVHSNKTRKVQSRAALALRRAAFTLQRSPSYLGAFYRRIRARAGTPKAITATARKIAVILYTMIKHGVAYKELGEQYYFKQNQERMIKHLHRQAQRLGFALVPQTL